VAAAQDTGGEADAGKWYDAAEATFTQLVDTKHAVSSAFQFINVPTGVWIDEGGRVVRPGEPSWCSNQHFQIGKTAILADGERYVAALRDWVEKGDRSQYALSDSSSTLSDPEMSARAEFPNVFIRVCGATREM